MKKVKLKQLKIQDFKGVKFLDITFQGDKTYIIGPNGSGKTTIFDAFNWLLFDKNSKYESDFEIKPLNEANEVIRTEPKVEGIFEIDGKEVSFQKTYKEKWVKKRGELEETFSGNETVYEKDNIPIKKSDYKKMIEEYFLEENKFKLLTNPLFFSLNLKWDEARRTLLEITGDVTDEEVIDSNKKLLTIKEEIEEKGIEELIASSKATQKKIEKSKKEIPIKIAELQKSITEINESDIKKEIELLGNEIKDIDKALSGYSVNSSKINELNDKKYSLINSIRDIENEEKNKFQKQKEKLQEESLAISKKSSELRIEMLENSSQVKIKEKLLQSNLEQIAELRSQYAKLTVEKPDLEVEHICPTCKREYTKEMIENQSKDIAENYNKEKAEKLKKIADEGTALKKYNERLNDEIETINNINKEIFGKSNKLYEKQLELNEKMKLYKEFILTDDKVENIKDIEKEITEIEKQIKEFEVATEDKDLKENKEILKKEISKLHEKIGLNKANENTRRRIKELEEEEKNISSKLVEAEKKVMLCEMFIISKVKLLESKINNKFRFVKFKLFNTQVNGGIKETCEALIDGVPFGNTNTASKINAGIDIINTISNHYNINLPIFVDNRESIILLEDTQSQIINLQVDNIDNLQILGGQFND